ncbi:glucodextranase DOMON-like domain-containing protein [Vitiosangium sp. GDMCC 1.1324]|uniref:glucodextranase DOMON-like domain-containing protein n=1 Tax=Vitiosangium sp. (strain GDMCC 1.1324) TaxID=2138576 RepID=UPI00130EB9B9|nr:glucodextranase DOMON-like domain-containing protein [Vitiosangium sp. GDMCC 1.1324]
MVLLRRIPLLLLLATLGGACHGGTRGGSPLFSLEDPRGDDHGDGELRYPLREDMGPGALDLLSFRAWPESGGTRFEATFARPIAVPQRRTVDSAGNTLADLARLGFYTFNLDVYVDEDRQEGSGRTDTLPGRNLSLAPGSAWEKAIVLTPRPYEARDVLRKLWRESALAEAQRQQGSVSASAVRALDEQVERQMEERVFFPTRVRVFGPTVSFFVPDSFLGGEAKPSWGYAVAVTGATLDRRVELPALLGGVTAPRAQGLMVLGIGPGVSQERFGGGRVGGSEQSPVVDLLVPEGVRQEEVLGPNAPGWPAVVPASPALPQAPDAGGVTGEGDAPASSAPLE